MRAAAIVAAPLALAAVAAAAQSIVPPPTLPAKAFGDNCAACHQENGQGIEGAFPALAGDKFVLGPPDEAIRVVLDGRGGMPSFRGDLTDAQIAATLTHVRTSWGNKASPVDSTAVAALRGNRPPPKNTGH